MTRDPSTLSLGALLRAVAAEHGPRTSMIADVSPARAWSWAELDAEVDRAVAHMVGHGVAFGDPVAYILHKRPEVVIGMFACARVGAVYVPVNHKLTAAQVRDQLATAGVRYVVFEPAFAALAAALDGAGGRVVPLDAWTPESEPLAIGVVPDVSPDAPVYYNYTSGSTGRPKGAITTSRQIIKNAVYTAEGLGFRPDDVYLGMFSVFAHPHELYHRSLLYGGAFVISDSMSPRHIADLVRIHGITWMMAVPSFYEMMLDHAQGGATPMPSLRVLEAGGAWVSPEALERMERAFSARFLPVWGSTETTGVGLGMLAEGPRRPGSTGKPIPGYGVRVVRDDGSDAAIDEVGELWMRSDATSVGYVNQPEETAAQFVDGWYATRDLVRIDADGFVWFSGRVSEMLKIGGIRVFPLEIEQVIATHPEVRGVVVVRAEDRLRGEIARAIVQRAPGSTVDARAVQAWCRARIASYKVPRIVELWDEIPRLPNGKIDKKAVLARPPGEGA